MSQKCTVQKGSVRIDGCLDGHPPADLSVVMGSDYSRIFAE